MTRWLKALAVIAASTLLISGCKKKEEQPAAQGGAQQQQQGKAGADSQAQAKPPEDAPKPIEGCNSDFKETPKTATTLTEKCSPYTIAQHLSVDGWDLTIEPGVELRMGAGAQIDFGYGQPARLTARGTPEKPIRFVSGGRKEPGAWKALRLYRNANGSVLEHVVIEHAGADDGAAIENRSEEVRLKNVKFIGLKSAAFEETHDGRTTELSDLDLGEAGESPVALSLYFTSVDALKGANKWPANAVIALQGSIGRDLVVPAAGIPYRVASSVNIQAASEGGSANVTISPGVTFQVGEGAEWETGYAQSGSLKAVGTPEQPITWTRFGEAEAGSWGGLEFHSLSKPPQLVHVKLEYAGGKDLAAIRYRGPKGLGKLQHATIAKSAGHAVMSLDGDPAPFEAFSDNTFSEIAQSTLYFVTEHATKLGPNNTYPQDGAIELEQEANKDVVLTAQGAPYLVVGEVHVTGESDVKATTLTVEPGAVVKFGPEGRLSVGYAAPATLKAVGAPDKPITFTAAVDSWKGLDIQAKGKLQLEHAVLEQVAADEPGIHLKDSAAGGSVKAVKFTGVTIPIRDCTKKLAAEGVKATDEGC